MARIPRSFARRARSTASIFLGTPSGSECACISIAPLRVCAFADNEITTNIAASCDLMDVPFIEQVSLELEVDLTRSSHWLPRQCANYVTAQRGAMPRPSEHDGNGEDKHDGKKLLERLVMAPTSRNQVVWPERMSAAS